MRQTLKLLIQLKIRLFDCLSNLRQKI